MKLKEIASIVTAALMIPSAFSCVQADETFKIALGGPESGSQYFMASQFSEELESLTNGKYSTDLFVNSQLGTEQSTVNDAAMGLLDFSVVAINNITPFSPTSGLFTLPYIFNNEDDVMKVLKSDATQSVVDNTVRDAGVRIVGWSLSGFRYLTNSKREIKTLDDLQGLVIRVPKNEIMIDTYRAWGINPTPMAWSEVFTALQQKVVDGQDLSVIDIEKSKFYEVQNYLSRLHYNFLLEPLIMSESIFQSQPKEVQSAILKAGKLATEESFKFLQREEESAIESLKTQGMKITSLDESEWREKVVKNVWPNYYETIGLDNINKALTTLGREPIRE